MSLVHSSGTFSTAPSEEKLEFNYGFTPETELFSSIRGLKFSSDSGEIHILLQQDATSPPVISKFELDQVLDIDGGLESAAISHEDSTKPFSYKYHPPSLKVKFFLVFFPVQHHVQNTLANFV